MAAYSNSAIDIDTKTWAQLLSTAISDGTIADVLAEAKIDDPNRTAVTASLVKTRMGAIYGDVVGRVLEECWAKARANAAAIAGIPTGEVTGSDSYSSTSGVDADFADLGLVPERAGWQVYGWLSSVYETGGTMYSSTTAFRGSGRRSTGGSLGVSAISVLNTGTASGVSMTLAADTNNMILRSRVTYTGTVHRSWRYWVDKVEL